MSVGGPPHDDLTSAPTVIDIDGTATIRESQSLPPPRLRENERIAGRYRVTGLLGRGGFGEVYEVADERRNDRHLALKLHRVVGGNAGAIDALKAEFALLASLSHPNLAQVHDFGWVGADVAFFTQEVVPGKALQRSGVELAGPRGVELLTQLCRALDYLHTRGILHRDVKPSNIHVDDRDHLTLLDFGISRAFGRVDDTRLAGTYAFIAPEAIRGGPVDARSDLYSLGVTLYVLVAGRPPFTGRGAYVLEAHLTARPPPIGDHVPAAVREVIERLLEKQPGDRYASASEVAEALALAVGVPATLETPETLASYVLSARFVGNEAVIDDLVRRTASDVGPRPRPSLIVGEAGTGKSRILREVQHRAQLEGRSWVAVEVDRHGDAKGLVASIAQAIVTPEVARMLSEDDRVELARGLPMLRKRGERIAIPVDPERARHARVEALGRAAALRFLTRPGAIVVEDLHRAEPETGPLLAELIAAFARSRAACFFLATSRPGEIADRIAVELGAERALVPLLSPRASGALVGSMFGDAEFLAETTLGRALASEPHPALYVQESLRLAVESGRIARVRGRWSLVADLDALPLGDVLAARIRSLSANGRRIALAAAVLGSAASAHELAKVAGKSVKAAAPVIRELVGAGVVEDGRDSRGRPVYTMHDRYIDAVLAQVTSGRLVAAHRRAGRYLSRRGRKDPAELARAAEHHIAAGDPSDARSLLERAAREADRVGRPDIAVRHLERCFAAAAAPDMEEIPLLVLFHDVATKAGRGDLAEEALSRLASARDRAKPADRVAIDLRRALRAARKGTPADALAICREARAWAHQHSVHEHEQDLLLAAAEASFGVGAIEDSLAGYLDAAAIARAENDRLALARASLGASLTSVYLGRTLEAEAYARVAAETATRERDGELRSDALRQLGTIHRERGDNPRALVEYRRAVRAARECGSIDREAKALNNLGTVAQWLGRVSEATEAFERSILLKERSGALASAHLTYNNLGALLVAVGRMKEGKHWLERVSSSPDASDIVGSIARSNLADALALEQRLDEAIVTYVDVARFCRGSAFASHHPHSLSGLVRALVMRAGPGDVDRAGQVVTELEGLRHVPEAERRYRTAHAAWLDACGHPEEALVQAEAATEVTDRKTRYSDVFGTELDAAWQRAILLARLGRRRDAETALAECRRELAKLTQAVGDLRAQRIFVQEHPMHLAIDRGQLAPALGWTWQRAPARSDP